MNNLPLPPLYPLINKSGKQISYFDKLVEYVSNYLKEDDIYLSFDGYTETILEYNNLKENDFSRAWELTKKINAWTEYFSSISNLIQKLYLDSETTKIETQAIASFSSDSIKVANGDRLANKDSSVVNARKKRNTLKSFYDELESKIKFMERAYYHCKATCDWATKPNQQNF